MNNSIVRFAVHDNNNFYKIDLSKTLLQFTEFDFTYFWEQCIEAGRMARKNGRLPQNIISNAKTVVSRAHPFVEACISNDYSEIVTDCIIEYICHSERIGLEELWARCITPKNLYETAIFRRISEYKANRAMNRWTSIVRLQEYARNKLEFIFGTSEGEPLLTEEIIRTRKEYFDLAVSVAANELGCPDNAMPSVRLCTPATLPNAAFAVSKVSKAIYRRFAEALSHGQDMSALENRNCSKIHDQVAMEAYAYVKNMSRPGEIDMNFALEAIRDNPTELYLPDSLKAVIDLEVELMIQRGIYLRKCESCGRYFTVTDDNTRCDRVNSSGKTCRKQYEELLESIAQAAKVNMPEEEIAPTPVPVVETKPDIPVTVPPETEKRSQKLYNALYKRVGKGIDENEFKEWSQYLSNMKRNLKIGEATLSQLDEFLDYSDRLCEEVKRASKTKTPHAPVEKTYERNSAPAQNAVEPAVQQPVVQNEPVQAPAEPQVATIVSSDEVNVKPFVPQTFDTLFDAFMAGYNDDDENEKVAPEKREKKHVEIKMPQWERLSREDAYGKKD
ncbi:MAG: hypothetical protein IJC04_11490 [Oscillospiraceae bacterium]|nr:hypothetical protein [Oscillospiraceae bacterium]